VYVSSLEILGTYFFVAAAENTIVPDIVMAVCPGLLTLLLEIAGVGHSSFKMPVIMRVVAPMAVAEDRMVKDEYAGKD
jgi:hypothetical protein